MATRREIERAYAAELGPGFLLSWVFFFILGWMCSGRSNDTREDAIRSTAGCIQTPERSTDTLD